MGILQGVLQMISSEAYFSFKKQPLETDAGAVRKTRSSPSDCAVIFRHTEIISISLETAEPDLSNAATR